MGRRVIAICTPLENIEYPSHTSTAKAVVALSPDGCTIAHFPVKIRGASADWTRAVAILDT